MVSEKPWRPEAVLLLGAGMLVVLSLSMIALFFVQEKGAPPGFVQFLFSTVVVQTFAVALIHFFLRAHGVRWSEFLGVRQRRVASCLLFAVVITVLAIPVALSAHFVSAKLVALWQESPEQQAVVKVLEATRNPAERAIFALAAIVMAPIVEETMFRGILYPLLKQRGYPGVALWGTSLLFAAIHVHVVTFLPLFVFALILVWIYERTDTLLAPIVAHSFFNAVNFILFLNQRQVSRWLDSLRERV